MCSVCACFPENIFIREQKLPGIGFSPSIQTKQQKEKGTGGKRFSSVPQMRDQVGVVCRFAGSSQSEYSDVWYGKRAGYFLTVPDRRRQDEE